MTSSRRRSRKGSGVPDPRTFVVNSLGAKAQSVAEIERKLAARQVPGEEARAAIEEAIRLGYLDDAELARQLARGARERRYGRRRAAEMLRRRGVPASDADAALADAYGESDEVALARTALGTRPVESDADRRRAVARLVRRGFSPESAWNAVRTSP